jgi:hypothetical protein
LHRNIKNTSKDFSTLLTLAITNDYFGFSLKRLTYFNGLSTKGLMSYSGFREKAKTREG